jgi:hypothetical protein
VWAIAAAGGIGAALTVALLSRRNQQAMDSAMRPIGGPYGNGPYREAICEPNRRVVDSLAEIAARLRQLPADNGLALDWQPLDSAVAEGVTEAGKGDFQAAVRHYCRAIRQLMGQIRAKQGTVDSTTGYEAK